jgi:hypothetical protein
LDGAVALESDDGSACSGVRTVGLAPEPGVATALASRGGYTYILDRRANALRRILSDF